ncbi:MAG: hypothetical protein E7490_02655 [Ruminococcaceae bacterium]|nr:hypothetical protein [Oscillospiraceae bacterium]
MKKKVISFMLSLAMVFTSIVTLSGCSNGGGIRFEVIQAFLLNDAEIKNISEMFDDFEQAHKEMMTNNTFANDELIEFASKIHVMDKIELELDSDTDYSKFADDIKRGPLDLSLANAGLGLASLNVSLGSCLPIQYYLSAIELINTYYKFFYGKEFISENQKNEIITKNNRISYKDNSKLIVSAILKSGAECENIGNLTLNVWKNCITQKSDTTTDKFTKNNGIFYSDFNDALTTLFEEPDYKTSISKIEIANEDIIEMMKFMTEVPDDYTEIYNELKSFVELYQNFSNLVINPYGSYNSYSDEYQTTDRNLVNQYNKMKIYLDM